MHHNKRSVRTGKVVKNRHSATDRLFSFILLNVVTNCDLHCLTFDPTFDLPGV